MKRAVKEQLWGLSRTQAKQVTVRFDIIAAVIGKEEAETLAVKIVGMAQKKTKSKVLAKAIKELEAAPPNSYGLATFNREDLVSCMQEAIAEAGGLDKMFPDEQDNTTPLQKIRKKVGKDSQLSLFSQEEPKEEKKSTPKKES